MAIDPSTITWDQPAPQQPAGVSASAIDPSTITWDQPAPEPRTAPSNYDGLINTAAKKYNLDPRLIRSQIQTESSFNPKAVSKAGARGLMQLMPATAADLGVADSFDPAQNIEGGAKYMRQLLDRYDGNWEKALAAYNGGMGNLDKLGMDKMPKESRDYVRKVMAGAGDLDVPMPGADAPQYRAPAAAQRPGDVTPSDSSLVNAAGRGAQSFWRGFAQDPMNFGGQALGMIMPDPLERALDFQGKTILERQAEGEADFQRQRERLGGEGFDPGRLAGNIASPTTLALGMTGGGPATTALGKLFAQLSPKGQAILGASLRGGAGAGMLPVASKNSGEALRQKGEQIGLGAVFGPLAEGVGKLAIAGGGKVAGMLRNELKPAAKAVLDEAQKAGVKLSAGDIASENKMITGVEGALENVRIPGLSMSGFRKEQQQQAQTKAQQVLDEEYKRLQAMPFMGEDRLRALAASNGARSAEARRVLQMIEDAGTDERAIMQASGNLSLLQKKISSDKLFDDVALKAGDSPVPPTATIKAIDDSIKDMGNVVDVDPQSLNLLQRWRDRLVSGGSAEGEDAIDAAVRQFEPGAAPPQEQAINTYQGMRQFRSDVRKRIDDATQGGMTDSSKLFLKRISTAIEQDMDDFAAATPGLKEANDRANKFYRDNLVPYQKKKLANALSSDDPDQIYSAFVRAQAEGRGDYAAGHFFRALDNKGRQAVRYGIVRQAMANALDGDQFSPAKFRSALESTEYKQYFRGPEAGRIDGLISLMGHLRRASPEHLQKYQAMLGGQLGIGGLGAGAGVAVTTGNVAPLLAGAGGGAFMRWLFTSDAGKRILFSSNILAKGGSQEKIGKLLDDAARQYNTAASATTGNLSGK